METVDTPPSQPSPPLTEVSNAKDLRSLDDLLTREMAQQRIQALIKGENLDVVVRKVLELTGKGQELKSAASLGRLAAVARGREAKVYACIPSLFEVEPPSIESLTSGEEKQYAAVVLRHATGEWLQDYCVREAVAIDSADNARKELLLTALGSVRDLSGWLRAIARQSHAVNAIEGDPARLRRVRRLFAAMFDVLKDWQGDLGKDPGAALGDALDAYLHGRVDKASDDLVADVLDSSLAILARMIETRFSHALDADSYAVLERGRRAVGIGWDEVLNRSTTVSNIRTHLLEAAVVLARQNRTDKRIIEVMMAAFGSRSRTTSAIAHHFGNARDIDPDVREWWINGGSVSESLRKSEHKVGNNEDQQIGALLIEVESNREAMEKLSRAVVPFLEISDPVLASTVKSAASRYAEIAQIARRLARMRKLSKTDLKGERMQYNPLEHEMLGGHVAGVRRIRVVRDGIQKEFGGKIKTLVKPWVETDE